MSAHKQIKTAAEALVKAAADLDTANSKIASLTAEIAELKKAKLASESSVKTAAEAKKAELAGAAKTASAALLGAGLLSSQEQADRFAAQILDPKIALEKIAAVAKHVTAPKIATVVADQAVAAVDANTSWDKKILALNSMVPTR